MDGIVTKIAVKASFVEAADKVLRDGSLIQTTQYKDGKTYSFLFDTEKFLKLFDKAGIEYKILSKVDVS